MDEFLCPECEKEADVCCASTIRFTHRLDLPYFVCVRCRTVYFDRRLVQERVSGLRKMDMHARQVPFRVIYRDALRLLETVVKSRIEDLGERFVRFRKKHDIHTP